MQLLRIFPSKIKKFFSVVHSFDRFIKCLSLSALVNGSAFIENKPENSHVYIIKDNENPAVTNSSVIIFIDSMYNLQVKYQGIV
jgi:hypothetical protein